MQSKVISRDQNAPAYLAANRGGQITAGLTKIEVMATMIAQGFYASPGGMSLLEPISEEERERIGVAAGLQARAILTGLDYLDSRDQERDVVSESNTDTVDMSNLHWAKPVVEKRPQDLSV